MHKQIWILVLLLWTFTSCTAGFRLARNFVQQETDIHVLVLPPPGLIKTFTPVHPDSLAPDIFFGVDHESARFVNTVDDSTYIHRFIQSLEYHLDLLYITVYGPDEIEEFFELEIPAYIFAVGQMELLEYIEVERLEGVYRGDVYTESLELTVLESNTWFEFARLHEPETEAQLLFSSHITGDLADPRFIGSARTGGVRFEPGLYRLSEQDLYDLAFFSGRQNAHNIFDHLLNLYVAKELGQKPRVIYHYDMQNHAIREVDAPGFIPIGKPAQNDH